MKNIKSSLTGVYFVIYALVCTFIIIAACAAADTTARRQSGQELPKEEDIQQTQEQKTKKELENARLIAFNMGYLPYNQGNYEQALPYLLETAKIDKQINPDSLKFPAVYPQIGTCYQKRGIIDSAYYAYNEGYNYYASTELYKHNEYNLKIYEQILGWLQWYHFSEKQIDKYIEFSEEISELEKDEAKRKQIIEDLKKLYISRREYEKALEKINELLIMEPENREFENERIGIIREIGGDEALISEWEEQHRKDSADSEVVRNLLAAYENRSEYAGIIEFADKYLALHPDDIDARVKKVNALQETGKIDEALDLLKELHKLNPEESQYLLDIAAIYQVDKKSHREAAKWAYNALKIYPELGQANLLFANIIIDYINIVKEKYSGKELSEIDHKLIHEIALEYFKVAEKDPNTKADAERMVNYCSQWVRDSEDKFMSKGYDKPKAPEYAWVWKYKK